MSQPFQDYTSNYKRQVKKLDVPSVANSQDPNYIALTDSANDALALTLGCNLSGPDSPNVYIIPDATNQAGNAITVTLPAVDSSPAIVIPAVGFGTYNNPFLFIDAHYVYTDYLNSLRAASITVLTALNCNGGVGSSGQVLTSQGANTPPTWTTISTGGGSNFITAVSSPLLVTGSTLSLPTSATPTFASLTLNAATATLLLQGDTSTWKMQSMTGNGNFYVETGSNAQFFLDPSGNLHCNLGGATAYFNNVSFNGSVVGPLVQSDTFGIIPVGGSSWGTLYGNSVSGNPAYSGTAYIWELSGSGLIVDGCLNVNNISMNQGYLCLDNTDSKAGYLQFGKTVTSAARLAQVTISGSPFPAVEVQANPTGSSWELGCLNTSFLFCDHINSSSGGAIYFFQNICGVSGSYPSFVAAPLVCSQPFQVPGGIGTVPGLWFGSGNSTYSSYAGNAGIGLDNTDNMIYSSPNGYIFLNSSGQQVLGIATGGSISTLGTVTVGNLGAQSYKAIYASSGGTLGYYSSSRRFKENIQTLDDCSWIYKLNPVSFEWKDKERGSDRVEGLIAEEVYAVKAQYAWLDKEGVAEGVHYEWLGMPLLVEVQKLRREVSELHAEIKVLRGD